MKTITIQIGNSDDRLTQAKWGSFVVEMRRAINKHVTAVHFFGSPANWEPWQNAAWVVTCDPFHVAALKAAIAKVREHFQQDSVAWTEGVTEFV